MYGLARRLDPRWIASATSSLPTPVSPRINTVIDEPAILSTSEYTRFIAGSIASGRSPTGVSIGVRDARPVLRLPRRWPISASTVVPSPGLSAVAHLTAAPVARAAATARSIAAAPAARSSSGRIKM